MKLHKYLHKALLSVCIALSQPLFTDAQTATVDSSILERLNELEKKASNSKPGEDHILIVGLATMGFATYKSTNTFNGSSSVTKGNSFPDADNFELSPMFIWRHGDKFLVEFEPSFNNNGLSVNWADVSWFAAPGLILRAGYIVLPFGTYSKREAAGWINKLATDPMGVADMAPTDYGFEVEGGLPLGNMKFNYDFAVSNGNQLLPDGTLTSGNIVDNNNNKTLTGRLGLLPFSNSSLELGLSAMYGKVGDQGSDIQNTMSQSYAFDLNYVKLLNPILLNVKAQYNIQNVDKVDYTNPSDSLIYSFDNHTKAYFVQGSLRPTGANGFIKNIELAGRYTLFNTPANSSFGSDQHTVTIGLNYWLSWRAVFKISYETYNGNSTASKPLGYYNGTTKTNTLFIHFAIQL